jgi:predicted TIM-barrel fold metal-dependent hydrolase
MTVISADSHIDTGFIPNDIFKDNAPAAMRDRMPTVAGRRPRVPNANALDPNFQRAAPTFARMLEAGLYQDAEKGIFRPGTPDLRLKDQDLDGIVGEVIYGVLGLHNTVKDDPEAMRMCFRIYADWVADFAKNSPGRFAPLTPLIGSNPDDAAEDLRYAAKIGLKGVELRPSVAVEPFWDEIWEPVWNAAEDTGLPVHFHSDIGILMSSMGTPKEEYRKPYNAVVGSIGKMANAQYLGTMILGGVLERHPKMTLVMGECDVSWIPHFLNRMDYMVTEREHGTGLPKLPSEYWYRQCRATFQSDKLGMEMIEHLGEDNIMWGNDYPHPDGVWPASHSVINATMAHLPERVRTKLTHDNVAKLYGFKN